MADTTNRITVEIDGDAESFKSTMEDAAKSFKQASTDMRTQIGQVSQGFDQLSAKLGSVDNNLQNMANDISFIAAASSQMLVTMNDGFDGLGKVLVTNNAELV